MTICPVRSQWASDEDPAFQFALRNVGDKDVFLNLGMTIGNGRSHFPSAVSLVLIDANGLRYELQVSGPPFIGGRVDDYAVGLQVGGVHVLKFSLSQFACPSMHLSKMKLPKGHYKIDHLRAGSLGIHWTSGLTLFPQPHPKAYVVCFDKDSSLASWQEPHAVNETSAI